MILVCPNCHTTKDNGHSLHSEVTSCPKCGAIMTILPTPKNNPSYECFAKQSSNNYTPSPINKPVPNSKFWLAISFYYITLILSAVALNSFFDIVKETLVIILQGDIIINFNLTFFVFTSIISILNTAGVVFLIIDAISLNKYTNSGLILPLLLAFFLPTVYFIYRGIQTKQSLITIAGTIYIIISISVSSYYCYSILEFFMDIYILVKENILTATSENLIFS